MLYLSPAAVLGGASEVAEVLPPDGCRAGQGGSCSPGDQAGAEEAAGEAYSVFFPQQVTLPQGTKISTFALWSDQKRLDRGQWVFSPL